MLDPVPNDFELTDAEWFARYPYHHWRPKPCLELKPAAWVIVPRDPALPTTVLPAEFRAGDLLRWMSAGCDYALHQLWEQHRDDRPSPHQKRPAA
jgi:hypothetical protein